MYRTKKGVLKIDTNGGGGWGGSKHDNYYRTKTNNGKEGEQRTDPCLLPGKRASAFPPSRDAPSKAAAELVPTAQQAKATTPYLVVPQLKSATRYTTKRPRELK